MSFVAPIPPIRPPSPVKNPTAPSSLPESAAFGDKTCANCKKPNSGSWCSRCAIDDVGQLRVFYCSKECQTSHWQIHKRCCTERRELARAVDLLDRLWTTFTAITYMQPIQYAKQKDGIITLKSQQFCQGWTGSSVFVSFPDEVFLKDVSEEIKRAVLLDGSSEDPGSIGQLLVNAILKPFVWCIGEVYVHPENPALVVVQNDSRPLDLPFPVHVAHTILRLRIRTGEEFALDLAGGQFGWKERLLPWDTYKAHRIRHVVAVNKLGWHIETQDKMNDMVRRDDCEKGPRLLRKAIMGGLASELDRVLTEKSMNIRDIVSIGNENFDTMRDELVAHAETYLKSRVARMKEQDIGRMYIDQSHVPWITMNRRTAQKYKEVWLTMEEYLKYKGNNKKLDEVWDQKLKEARG